MVKWVKWVNRVGGASVSSMALAIGLSLGVSGCADDVQEAGATDGLPDEDTDPVETSSGSSSSSSGAPITTAGDGEMPCDAGCDVAPGDCYEEVGTCEDGVCSYPPKLAGEPCADDCEAGGFCDASGQCICSAGGCEDTCTAGEHATASCDDAGRCVRTCEAPWDNCDGDWSNGCEVPVGIPGVCDAAGLNMQTGCWTAWCGASEAPETFNFETYYCADCPTCREEAGQFMWCNHDTGQWYPSEPGTCDAAYLDVACGA